MILEIVCPLMFAVILGITDSSPVFFMLKSGKLATERFVAGTTNSPIASSLLVSSSVRTVEDAKPIVMGPALEDGAMDVAVFCGLEDEEDEGIMG